MKNVFVVGTVGLPGCYGGFESLVENLVSYSSDSYKYTVFCSSKAYDMKIEQHNGARLIYIPFKANGIQSVIYDIVSLLLCLRYRPDVILILGVSGCIFLPIFKVFSKAKIVTNIDGLEWKRDKWGWFAKKFLKFSEYLAVKFSNVVITDNKAIGDYVDLEYGNDNIVIPYGGDHAISSTCKYPEGDYCLALCRIEPENNVEMILKAFQGSTRSIKFVGNWNASEYGRRLKVNYSQENNIELIDPIYDLDELFKLRSSCQLYIHGHSAGGTNPSLVEMMHFNKPIAAFDCVFNRYSTENEAQYFDSSYSLKLMIENKDEKALLGNANSMKKIAEKRYVWSEITKQYESTYN
ncbi:DUF1972 domain-containing protein [Photobacterium sp. GJ3]|uniref:DUF1972 domain-containing protein n=1 Tax=Photobacterium sp. GJ3 TaxID=2829502 RepID=UPI001B8B0CA3|nr:DUF1972 domain-containing protein [Photobacterium sp. GJ3]QUJ68211.1 DUF1972 domain-containing protein [Photobacterium sp. GJ3]